MLFSPLPNLSFHKHYSKHVKKLVINNPLPISSHFWKIRAQKNEPRAAGTEGSDEITMAEKRGFEPLLGLHLLPVFETGPFNHLGTSPDRYVIIHAKTVVK